jgi:hypothetical protein
LPVVEDAVDGGAVSAVASNLLVDVDDVVVWDIPFAEAVTDVRSSLSDELETHSLAAMEVDILCRHILP